MSDRTLGHVRRSRDECPCHPSVPVVMHDADEQMPFRLTSCAEPLSRCPECDVPPEITEARANLPERRPTDRDWFAEARRG